MGKLAVGLIAFAGGVAVGLLAAKIYARSQVEGGIGSIFGALGLGGSKAEKIAKSLGGDLLV